jgi:hypothetical protein
LLQNRQLYRALETFVGSTMMSFVQPFMTTAVMVRTSVINVTAAPPSCVDRRPTSF